VARVVFLGTPEFAVPSLEALAAHPAFEVVSVVTQPDRPAGRGQQVRPSAVKVAAGTLGLPVFQPQTLRDEAAVEHLRGWQPDVVVVAAFGQILRRPVLELAPHGCVNVHASLLPRWRGAAPIQCAIRAGDAQTGVTIMKIDKELDAGPIIAQAAVDIAPRETAATLHDKLAQAGADLLPGALLGYLRGEIEPQPQPNEGVTHAPTLQKGAGRIDWAQTADEIDRQVRAYHPWPGTFTNLGGELLKVIGGRPLPGAASGAPPGTLAAWQDGLAAHTGAGLYLLETVQPAGKKPMAGQAFLAGRRDVIGRALG
jgi:methionyl-tRNA formyltransferase